MENLQLLVDLHKNAQRLGPGSEQETNLAITLSGLRGRRNLKIADIGCGTGASTLVLAQQLEASITAIDFFPDFLKALEEAAHNAGIGHKITPLAQSMENLPFQAQELDAIWAEGAIYNIGFEAGIAAWRPFLKPGGILAVSEITWLTASRPEELQTHWDREYPEIDTAAGKISVLERHGFSPIGYFPLPDYCWLENYYVPLQKRFEAFLHAHNHSAAAKAIIEAERAEIALYERHKQFVSYGFYIVKKLPF